MKTTAILTPRSEASTRTAVIREEIDSVWLYLSRPGEMRPDVACWILNTPEAPHMPDFATYRRQSAPPPLPVAQSCANPPDPRQGQWSFLWSADGHAVAALLNERPIAFVVAGRPRGYASYVKSGAEPWALPWDEEIYTAAFGRRG